MVPFVSLDAATSVGPGASVDLEDVLTNHAMIVVVEGDFASRHIELQGSHDGALWAALASADPSSTPQVVTVSDTPVRYVRANVASLSGASPSVTATIASA